MAKINSEKLVSSLDVAYLDSIKLGWRLIVTLGLVITPVFLFNFEEITKIRTAIQNSRTQITILEKAIKDDFLRITTFRSDLLKIFAAGAICDPTAGAVTRAQQFPHDRRHLDFLDTTESIELSDISFLCQNLKTIPVLAAPVFQNFTVTGGNAFVHTEQFAAEQAEYGNRISVVAEKIFDPRRDFSTTTINITKDMQTSLKDCIACKKLFENLYAHADRLNVFGSNVSELRLHMNRLKKEQNKGMKIPSPVGALTFQGDVALTLISLTFLGTLIVFYIVLFGIDRTLREYLAADKGSLMATLRSRPAPFWAYPLPGALDEASGDTKIRKVSNTAIAIIFLVLLAVFALKAVEGAFGHLRTGHLATVHPDLLDGLITTAFVISIALALYRLTDNLVIERIRATKSNKAKPYHTDLTRRTFVAGAAVVVAAMGLWRAKPGALGPFRRQLHALQDLAPKDPMSVEEQDLLAGLNQFPYQVRMYDALIRFLGRERRYSEILPLIEDGIRRNANWHSMARVRFPNRDITRYSTCVRLLSKRKKSVEKRAYEASRWSFFS